MSAKFLLQAPSSGSSASPFKFRCEGELDSSNSGSEEQILCEVGNKTEISSSSCSREFTANLEDRIYAVFFFFLIFEISISPLLLLRISDFFLSTFCSRGVLCGFENPRNFLYSSTAASNFRKPNFVGKKKKKKKKNNKEKMVF